VIYNIIQYEVTQHDNISQLLNLIIFYLKNNILITLMNMKDIIRKIIYKDFKSSVGWDDMTKTLRYYLENENIDLFRVNEIKPHIFIWPEDSQQNKLQLNLMKKNKECIFYRTAISNNDYGPTGVKLYNNVQLDRVAQVWSIYILVNKLKLDLVNANEIIFEFGGGTGQMADVLKDLNFQGKHIIYDLPLMVILQKYFIDKRNIKTKYILDDENNKIIKGTNFLPCNQNESEKYIVKLPNINFIATYSLTETDLETHEIFSNYLLNFNRILIIYWPQPVKDFDNIDNEAYINNIINNIKNTHYCYIDDNFGNGKIFCAMKK